MSSLWFFFNSKIENFNNFSKQIKSTSFFVLNLNYIYSIFTYRNKSLQFNQLVNTNSRSVDMQYTRAFSLFFVKFFIKNGSLLKANINFQWAISQLYSFIFQNIEKKKTKYSNFFFLFNMIRFNQDFFNINTFFFWLLKNLSYSFYFKVIVLPKFLKKKLKQRYLIEPLFIQKQKRLRAGVRIFSFNIHTNTAFLLKYRFLNSFIDLAFNLKKSKFFLDKNKVYSKIFKLLKKKKKLG